MEIPANGGAIPITSKDIKYLFEINQDIKALFSKYYINNGHIGSTQKYNLITKGIHHAEVEHDPIILDSPGYIVVYDAQTIYKVLNKNKSKIDGIHFNGVGHNDNKIYIHYNDPDMDPAPIAAVIHDINLQYVFPDSKSVQNYKNMEFHSLTDEDIDVLANKQIVVLETGTEYETPISKELLPGLKVTKNKRTYGGYAIEPSDSEIFYLYLYAEHETIRSFHQYRCFKW